MIIQLLLLILGLALLLGGGNALVRGASALAKDLGVSTLIIGLTVVAFGTSAPELAINVTAALKDSGEISFGNVIGSNIANIGLILALSALLRPLEVEGTVVSREIPMMILASAAAVVMGFDQFLRHAADAYDRTDGLLLLLLFGVFMYYTISEVIKKRIKDPFFQQVVELVTPSGNLRSLALNALLIFAGLIALTGGGRITVDSAVSIAQALNVSKAVIGLTIVAVGTSLPELVTSLIAAKKGQTELAIGNIVGSNIFNLLFVTGISATIRPIPVPPFGYADLLMMLFLSLILVPLSISNRQRIVRLEGGVLFGLYVGYSIWRTVYAH